MPRHITPDEAFGRIRTRQQLLDSGWRPRQIQRAVAGGEIRRLQQNRYVHNSLWNDLWPESRHVLEVVAAHTEMRDGGAVAAYASAGVLFGVPLYRHVPDKVHLLLPEGSRSSSRAGLLRHREPILDADVTELAGIRCTTLERTTFDVIRVLSREAAVAFADAALRAHAWSGSSYDFTAAAEWRDRMAERVARAKGARGVRQAGEVVAFADGRAQLPGESVSRLQLSRLGFRRFDLQVRVPGPDGSSYYVDIGLEDVDAFYEFDGQAKYLDEALRSGRTLEEVLLDEKRREDWIRGTTQRRMARGEDAHIVTPAAMAARLTSFGIQVPVRVS